MHAHVFYNRCFHNLHANTSLALPNIVLAGCVLLLFRFMCSVVCLIFKKKKGRTLKEAEGKELP